MTNSALAGTGALARLAVRTDRVWLPVWVGVLALLPAATSAQYRTLYPNEQSIRDIAGVLSNPSLVAMSGPLFRPSYGGLTTWKVLATELILASLMSLLTVIRHTRTEEETGRLELVGAGAVGRLAPLTAALLVTVAANLAATVLIALGLTATGLAPAGSLAFGLAVGGIGAVFAATAAVAAQLTTSARTAIGIGAGALGVSYLVRVIGDTGSGALSWASPFGWGLLLRPFADERWWILVLLLALGAVLTVVAYGLAGRRDVGAGLLPERAGPARARSSLSTPLGLAWRLNRGLLAGWAVAIVVWGYVLGGVGNGIEHASGVSQEMIDVLARLGGTRVMVDAYLSAVLGITGLLAAAYGVQATLRLRVEESSGRVEPLLATPATRLRWAASHLVFALLGPALLLALTGAAAGLAYGLAVHDVGGQVPRLLGAALVQTPAVWVLVGLGVVLFGLVPRFTALAWAGLVACLLLLELGALLGLSQWLIDVSPFAHIPKLPGSAFTATPLVWLTATATALLAVGLTGLRRRDID